MIFFVWMMLVSQGVSRNIGFVAGSYVNKTLFVQAYRNLYGFNPLTDPYSYPFIIVLIIGFFITLGFFIKTPKKEIVIENPYGKTQEIQKARSS
jgi:hypothetical protein